MTQPKSLEGVKEEFDKKFVKHTVPLIKTRVTNDAFHSIEFVPSDELWSFISQQISQAEERGEKRMLKKVRKEFNTCTGVLAYQANEHLERLSHKSTKQKGVGKE